MDTKNLIDKKRLDLQIQNLITENDIYKRKRATLRVQISRLKKLKKAIEDIENGQIISEENAEKPLT